MIRILLLRVLIAWWAIPLFWVIVLPLDYLTCGDFEKSVSKVIDVSKELWSGVNKWS